ncbi:hypothetical protein HanOQP8_Chr15g0585761 [Helianthus annuus]|nr:uncharacterized protein LOC110912232 isoform X1 [Helianthus annuus]XP_022012600.1 uncharacterized protein LOC110912232 isoform X1 [Helianthus annuus]KAJ0474290.1 hypothetical protein HanHA89_Chr15g0627951 [Helianthus annuus]KAJ0653638.1 hypothetical protein HanOQP8_Chr15g0585761 [Helianthus annuus]
MGGGKKIVDRRFTGHDANEKIAIHQIMLKYRPIAPRPVTAEIPSRSMTCIRSKRKYVRVKNKDKAKSTDSDMTLGNTVLKVPDWNYNKTGSNGCDAKNPNFFMSNVNTPPPKYLHDADLSMAVHGGKVMESWITTESLTGACEVGRWLGYADEMIRKNLENDSSPGFISNCFDEVEWVNLAYRRIGDPCGGAASDVVVWLAIKFEKLAPVKYWHCFSCRVRVEYEFLNKKSHMMVPCDVWKMDSGGFAWRLDVGAALCLGRIS